MTPLFARPTQGLREEQLNVLRRQLEEGAIGASDGAIRSELLPLLPQRLVSRLKPCQLLEYDRLHWMNHVEPM